MSNEHNKTYLGDGCYVRFDGYSIWLTTENGVSVTNEICLEPEVYLALTQFVDRLAKMTLATAIRREAGKE